MLILVNNYENHSCDINNLKSQNKRGDNMLILVNKYKNQSWEIKSLKSQN